MTFTNEQDDERRRRSAHAVESQDIQDLRPKKKRGGKPEVGNALRAAYQQTIDESIPPEFLDLLGKLG